jgi:CRISPR system Cascade subunit CasE
MTQLYLIRLTLNPRSREARRDAASAYELHCTLRTRLFGDPVQEAGRTLFRVERDPDTGISTVLIQSHLAPNFAALPSGYWLHPAEVRSDYAEKLQTITTDQYLRFRLMANPTVKRKSPEGKPARYGLYSETEQRDWLARKLADNGARLIDFSVKRLAMQNFRKHGGDEKPQTHFAVRFDGILQVLVPDNLLAAVAGGIGSAKGYGFGLLSLAPAGG